MSSRAARRVRDERGVAYPSPLVMLSVIAVAMAGIAFVATKDQPEQERKVEIVSRTEAEPPAPEVAPEPEPPAPEPEKPAVERGKIYVEVYNNTGVKGLAATTAEKVSGAGWQVVGTDNWVGTIPAPTVYFAPRLKAAAELLALDLGIQRVQPAVSPMKQDRLTVILSG